MELKCVCVIFDRNTLTAELFLAWGVGRHSAEKARARTTTAPQSPKTWDRTGGPDALSEIHARKTAVR